MSKQSSTPKVPAVCPVCGEDVPRRALACPECGADHRSGWRDDAEIYDGVHLPDADFDYAKFVQNEFGGGAKPVGLKKFWWVTAVLLIVTLAVIFFYTIR